MTPLIAGFFAPWLTHHWVGFPAPSPGVLLYVALFTWFVADYLVFERVHRYTYDLVAERIGFKLIWGCVAFYALARSCSWRLACRRFLARGGPGDAVCDAEVSTPAPPRTSPSCEFSG